MTSRTCAYCGTVFSAHKRTAKYCSPSCKRKHLRAATRERLGIRQSGTVASAVCRFCLKPFSYTFYRRPRLFCDECRAIAYASKKKRVSDSSPKHEVVCRFCAKTFRTASNALFCPECFAAGFNNVYTFRKQSNPFWQSAGDRVLRGLPAVSHDPGCDFRKWLKTGSMGPKSDRCGIPERPDPEDPFEEPPRDFPPPGFQ